MGSFYSYLVFVVWQTAEVTLWGSGQRWSCSMGWATARVGDSSQTGGNYNTALKKRVRGNMGPGGRRRKWWWAELSKDFQFLMLYLSYREPQILILLNSFLLLLKAHFVLSVRFHVGVAAAPDLVLSWTAQRLCVLQAWWTPGRWQVDVCHAGWEWAGNMQGCRGLASCSH